MKKLLLILVVVVWLIGCEVIDSRTIDREARKEIFFKCLEMTSKVTLNEKAIPAVIDSCNKVSLELSIKD